MGSTSARKKTKIGDDYVHFVVDDHSRLAFREIRLDERADTTAGFFDRAVEFFVSHGIAIERLMTDNAWTDRRGRRLRELLAEHDIEHKFIRPHCPWQNGEDERFDRHQRIGRSPLSTVASARMSVSSLRRVPTPPAR